MPGLKLMAQLGLDGSGFESGFRRMHGIAEGVAQGIKRVMIQAVGMAAVEEAMRKTVETARELVLTSQELAIAPEQLQIMRQAARESNFEFEKLAQTIDKINDARQKALIPGNEGRDARRAFAAIGVRGEALRMPIMDLLMGPLRQTALTKNPQELGIIFEQLGIKVRNVGPMFNFLRTDFEALSAQMKKMGAIMDADTAMKLKGLSDEFLLLSRIITSQFGPAMIRFAEWAYRALLKLGSGALSGYGVAGQMLKEQGAGGTSTSFLSALGHMVAHSVGFISDAEYYSKMAALAPKSKGNSGPNFFDEAMKQFDEFMASLSKKAKELEHPAQPSFTSPALPQKFDRKSLLNSTDALVRVGNFLGGSGLTINRIAERQLYWLERIAQNTASGKSERWQLNSGYVSQMGPNFPHT